MGVKSKLPIQSEKMKKALDRFFKEFIPEGKFGKFCSEIGTSALESFNGFHHQKFTKNKYFRYYEERVLFSTLRWNLKRTQEYFESEISWMETLKRWQQSLGLFIIQSPTEYKRNRKKPKQKGLGKTAARKRKKDEKLTNFRREGLCQKNLTDFSEVTPTLPVSSSIPPLPSFQERQASLQAQLDILNGL